jgi:hypothetical protein
VNSYYKSARGRSPRAARSEHLEIPFGNSWAFLYYAMRDSLPDSPSERPGTGNLLYILMVTPPGRGVLGELAPQLHDFCLVSAARQGLSKRRQRERSVLRRARRGHPNDIPPPHSYLGLGQDQHHSLGIQPGKGFSCPFRVKLRSLAGRSAYLFYHQEQTSSGYSLRSVWCQKTEVVSGLHHFRFGPNNRPRGPA